MDRLTFSNNSADFNGGGMYVQHSNCTFNGQVTFSNNSAGYDGDVFNSNCNGGGMGVFNSQCIFKDEALFSGNSAGESGGSLFAETKSSIEFLSLVNIFTGTAGREGGGILVRDDCLLVMSGETIMKDNHALSYGGAISLESSDLQMKGSSKITSNSAQYGGAIQAMSSKVYISGYHHFENNSADYGGGWALSGGSLVYFLGIGLNPYCIPFH